MCYALPAQHAWGELENHTAAAEGMVVTTVEVQGQDLTTGVSTENKLARKKEKGWRASFKLKQRDDKEQQKPDKNIKLLHKGKNINLELCSVGM